MADNPQFQVVDVDGEPVEFPADMSDADIKAAIGKMKPGKATTAATEPATMPQDASKSHTNGFVPPGVIGMVGSAVKQGAPYARTGVNFVAEQAAKSPNAAAATVAAAASHMTGLPWWEGMVGSRLLGLGKLIKPGAQALADATSTAMPRIAGRFAAMPAGRAAANTVFKRVIPGVGEGLMATDAARGGWMLGSKLREKLGTDDMIGRAYNALTGNGPATAPRSQPNLEDLDPLVLEMMQRSK